LTHDAPGCKCRESRGSAGARAAPRMVEAPRAGLAATKWSPPPPAVGATLALLLLQLAHVPPAGGQMLGGGGGDDDRMDIVCSVNHEDKVTVEIGLHDHVEVVLTHLVESAENADAEVPWPHCHASGECSHLVLDLEFDEEVHGAVLRLPDGTLVRIARQADIVIDMSLVQSQLETEAEALQTDYVAMGAGNVVAMLLFCAMVSFILFLESQWHCFCGSAVHTLHQQQQDISRDIHRAMTFLEMLENAQ
jgi:hypothetical protein